MTSAQGCTLWEHSQIFLFIKKFGLQPLGFGFFKNFLNTYRITNLFILSLVKNVTTLVVIIFTNKTFPVTYVPNDAPLFIPQPQISKKCAFLRQRRGWGTGYEKWHNGDNPLVTHA